MMKCAATTLALVMALAAGAVTDATMAAGLSAHASTVQVTVKYTGKGPVDASHLVWLWLFDTPDIGPGAMPIGQMSVGKNGETAAFEGVTAATVWIAAAYDESGTMTGNAPPPSGTPIGIYASSSGAPQAVTAGDNKPVTLIFDDSQRMP